MNRSEADAFDVDLPAAGAKPAQTAPEEALKAILPLRYIFWGALLCVLDFSLSSTKDGIGWRIDVLNDAVGAILIAVGVFRLGDLAVHARYASAMKFVKIMAIVEVARAVHDHLVWSPPLLIAVALTILSLATLAAIVVFCVAMRWLCREAGLRRSQRSWRTTLLLFIVLYVVPIGAFQFLGLASLLFGTQWSLNTNHPAIVIPLVVVFLLPVIHLLVSTRRTAREARSHRPAPSVIPDDSLPPDVEGPPAAL